MNFEEIWQEHRAFILTVLVFAIVFFGAKTFVESSFSADIARDRRAAAKAERNTRRLRKQLPPGRVHELEAVLERLEDRLARLEKTFRFRPDPRFILDPSRPGDIQFNETVERMLTEVVEFGLTRDVRIQPDLGLQGVTPRTQREREWYLQGLDVVERVAIAAIASGVRSVEPIVIERAPSKKKRERATTVSPYLSGVSVSFTAEGPPAAVDALLRGLMLPDHYVAVVTARVESTDDPDRGNEDFSEPLVRLTTTVRTLVTDEEGTPREVREKRL